MKIYCVAGRYLRTQEEAKARAKERGIAFNPVTDIDDVPTDAKGLIAYLNELVEGLSVYTPGTLARAPEPVHTIVVDEAFEGLPITHQLTLTALALENARNRIVELEGEKHYGARVTLTPSEPEPDCLTEDLAEEFI